MVGGGDKLKKVKIADPDAPKKLFTAFFLFRKKMRKGVWLQMRRIWRKCGRTWKVKRRVKDF